MEKHSDAFKRFLLEDHLREHHAQKAYFERLIQNAVVYETYFLGEEIKQFAQLPEKEYLQKLQGLLNNPLKGIDIDEEITGIEDSESVVYVENIGPNRIKLTNFQTYNEEEFGVSAALYHSEVGIGDGMLNNSIQLGIGSAFYGALAENQFHRIGDESLEEMSQVIRNTTITFIEQLNLIKSLNTGGSGLITRN